MTTRKYANMRYTHLFLTLPIILILLASGCQSSKQNASLKSELRKPNKEAGQLASNYNFLNKNDKKLAKHTEIKKSGKAYSKFGSNKKQFINGGTITAQPKSKVHSVVKTAFSQVGTPYRFGGNSPETGFDCSGFVKWVFHQYDIKLPRQSKSMMGVGTPIPRHDLRPGDLVFFGRKKRVSHVGIYTGGNKYIHSPSTGKRIQESSLDDRARGERYIAARRIINNAGINNIDEQLKDQWVAEARENVIRNDALSGAIASAEKKSGKKTRTSAVKTGSVKKSSKKSMSVQNVQAKKPVSVKSKTKSAKSVVAKGQSKHKVMAGDTLYDLSKKYGVSAEALAKANNLTGKGKSNLKLGQTLVLPKKVN